MNYYTIGILCLNSTMQTSNTDDDFDYCCDICYASPIKTVYSYEENDICVTCYKHHKPQYDLMFKNNSVKIATNYLIKRMRHDNNIYSKNTDNNNYSDQMTFMCDDMFRK